MIPEPPPGTPGSTAAAPPRPTAAAPPGSTAAALPRPTAAAPPRPTATLPPGRPRIYVLGTAIDDVTFDEAVARIADLVADGRASGRSHRVVTPNPEIVVQARRDPALAAALAGAALATPDGVGIRWAARAMGTSIRAVVPGSALTVRIAAAAAVAEPKWRMFLLGAAEGVAAAAAERLAAAHPGIQIVGTFAGSPRDEDRGAVQAAIAVAAPVDIVLVAYGTPAQECWLAENLAALKIPVGMGVGGTFNFIAGVAPWPPKWVARLGLIWLWRLATEPWRWRRQLRLVRFVGLVLVEAVRRRVRVAIGRR